MGLGGGGEWSLGYALIGATSACGRLAEMRGARRRDCFRHIKAGCGACSASGRLAPPSVRLPSIPQAVTRRVAVWTQECVEEPVQFGAPQPANPLP
jgi:hypothetical protein